jgi:hypothetical protein
MAILTKAQLQAANSASFADNNDGAITPQILRDYNSNVIDTLVDSLDTGSFATTSSFNTYTASLNTSASLALVTASFDNNTRNLTFTKGDNATFSINIPDVSGSVGNFATTGSNTFTGQQILSNTASLQFPLQIISGGIRIDDPLADWIIWNSTANGGLKRSNNADLELSAQSASLLIRNTAGRVYISGSQVLINEVDFIPFSASLNTRILASVTTASFNSYTASQSTASLVTSITNLNTFTSSQLTINTAIGASTSSLNTATASLFTSTSLSLTTASFSGNTLTFTKGNGTTFGVVIPDVSGSSIPTGTISGSSQITALGFVSSSVTASSLVTASFSGNTLTFTKGNGTTFGVIIPDVSGSTINTGSFATTGSNSFNGNQTITGSLNVRTITTLGLNPTPSTANTGSGTSLYFLNQDINGGAQPSIYNITAGWVMSGTGITDGTVTSVGGDDNGISVNITSGNVVNGNSYIGTGPYAQKLIVTGGVFTDTNGFQSPGGLTVQNGDGTPVAYGGIGIQVDTTTDPTNVFSTLYAAGATSEATIQMGLSSYTPTYSGETVPVIYAGGNYNGLFGETDTTITFYSSSIQNWKPTQFKANVNITGSLGVSSTFTASLQQGYAWVGGSGNKTIAVATSSFGSTPAGTVSSSAQILNYGIFATTGSNTFRGNQTITGSLTVSGAVSIQGDTTFVNKNGATSNVILGSNAMSGITGSVQNSIAIGEGAMRYASGSDQNVAIGYNVLAVTVGTNNTAIGSSALESNRTGNNNLAFGVGAMNKNTTGATNVALGNGALANNVSSSFNIAIGADALKNNITDSQIAIGGGALEDTTLGNVNIAIGRSTMQKNTTGFGNVAVGANAMQNATGSNNNIVIGNAAMQNATSTEDNVAIGVSTMPATQGNKNTAIGRNSLGQDTTGQQNTAIGYNSGYGITTGNYNTLIGSATGSAGWNNVIALSDGQGNIEAIYSGSVWSMNAPVNFTTGSNQQAGTAVLDGGNPGAVTVSNSLVTANSIIMLTKQTLTNAHMVAVTAKSGGSFTITSNGNGDADTVGWFIINNS